jgi:hypothetical protein
MPASITQDWSAIQPQQKREKERKNVQQAVVKSG